jgi:hypothetical protein
MLVIAVALIGYGVYRAFYLPGMLAVPSAPLLFVGFCCRRCSASRPASASGAAPARRRC